MKSILVILLSLFLSPIPFSVLAAGVPYNPAVSGKVVGYRLAGIEPDGDPLNQVMLSTTLSASGGIPTTHLIINSYLENFKPDTTPILPDLLHPKQDAQNLGGFLNGKALLTDDAGNVLYSGDFLAEAFLDNSNHAVIAMDGVGTAKGGSVRLKGIFALHKDGSLGGSFTGTISLPTAARAQIQRERGKPMRSVDQILKAVTVKPHAMMGRATKSSSNVVLHTGYGPAPARNSGPHFSTLTILAAAGALISFAWAGFLFWRERRRPSVTPTPPPAE